VFRRYGYGFNVPCDGQDAALGMGVLYPAKF
jgi:hypothetical protein